jgi:hypothetical protein
MRADERHALLLTGVEGAGSHSSSREVVVEVPEDREAWTMVRVST